MTIIPECNEDRYIQHPLGNYNLIKFPTMAEVETNAIEIRKYVMKIIL